MLQSRGGWWPSSNIILLLAHHRSCSVTSATSTTTFQAGTTKSYWAAAAAAAVSPRVGPFGSTRTDPFQIQSVQSFRSFVATTTTSTTPATSSIDSDKDTSSIKISSVTPPPPAPPLPPKFDKVRILYASQTGTAQMFALQLAEALDVEDYIPLSQVPLPLPSSGVSGDETKGTVDPWWSPTKEDTLYIFIVSTAGVGEAPDNGRAFYEALVAQQQSQQQQQQQLEQQQQQGPSLYYSIFALGNSAAHANHFCAFGQDLDAHLQNVLGAQPVVPLVRGDDAGCIEDDFDQYQQTIVDLLSSSSPTLLAPEPQSSPSNKDETATASSEASHDAGTVTESTVTTAPPPSPPLELVPSRFPTLELIPPDPTRNYHAPATDLLNHPALLQHGIESSHPLFYAAGTRRFPVQSNHVLRSDAASNSTNPSALREMQLQIPNDNNSNDNKNMKYETGDHLIVYPRNSDVLVEAYLQVIQEAPHPHSIIAGVATTVPNSSDPKKKVPTYPHPRGITLYETLRHCVDLQALPSPSLARYIISQQQQSPDQAAAPPLDYKTEIAQPRRTVLDLLLLSSSSSSHPRKQQIPLADLLFQLPALQPRYYSIASSPSAHPDKIYLTYRPVKYYTSAGILREGVCTSYLSNVLVPPPASSPLSLSTATNATTTGPFVVAAIRSNPQFRLPMTTIGETPPPLILVAGGCGVAPIRAFLEELVWEAQQYHGNTNNKYIQKYGPAHLFLGFRHPDDEVYRDLVDTAVALGVVAKPAHITYTTGGGDDSGQQQHQCGLVSEAMLREGQILNRLLRQERAVLFVCGGARLFGAAIQNALLQILQQPLPMVDDSSTMMDAATLDETAATDYLRTMHREGRYHEDLSD